MVRVRYGGLTDPRAEFEALRPFRSRLIRMSMTFFPMKDDYQAVHAVIEALDAACLRFTADERFYHGLDTGRIGGKAPGIADR